MNLNALATTVFDALSLPDSAFIGVSVAKKTLQDNAELTSSDKALVKDVIKKIEWRYTLKPDNTNIVAFEDGIHEYTEIAVLHVWAKSRLKTKQVCKLLHQLIPYPLLLVITNEEAVALSLADKRINQVDNSKLTTEHQFDTGWLEGELNDNATRFFNDLSFNNLSKISLYDFYLDWIDKFNRLDAAKHTGIYKSNEDSESSATGELTHQLDQLKAWEAELILIRNKIKKETQMSNKVKLNMEAHHLKQKIAEIKALL